MIFDFSSNQGSQWKGDLFNKGEQFLHITGGWTIAYDHEGDEEYIDVSIGETMRAEVTKVLFESLGGTSYLTAGASIKMIAPIDLSNYSKLYVHVVDASNNSTDESIPAGYVHWKSVSGSPMGSSGFGSGESFEQVDVSHLNGYYYLYIDITSDRRNSFEIDKIWLS